MTRKHALATLGLALCSCYGEPLTTSVEHENFTIAHRICDYQCSERATGSIVDDLFPAESMTCWAHIHEDSGERGVTYECRRDKGCKFW
jgi:hypothetical protein